MHCIAFNAIKRHKWGLRKNLFSKNELNQEIRSRSESSEKDVSDGNQGTQLETLNFLFYEFWKAEIKTRENTAVKFWEINNFNK